METGDWKVARPAGWKACTTLSAGLRQIGFAHQETVALAGGAAAFVEGPHHEALAATAIAAGKHVFEVRAVFVEVGLHVRARVAFDAERVEQRLFGPEETHCE